MSVLPSSRVRAIALANLILLTLGGAAHADEIEAYPPPPSVLLSSMLPPSVPLAEDDFAPKFGVRKGRGFQFVQPIEVNDRTYEFNLSGPFVKAGSKQKNLGLVFELRF